MDIYIIYVFHWANTDLLTLMQCRKVPIKIKVSLLNVIIADPNFAFNLWHC